MHVLRNLSLRTFLRRLALVLVLVAAIGSLFRLLWLEVPPNENALLAQFRLHRAAFEDVRQILLGAPAWRSVARWGVTTYDFPVPKVPVPGDASRPAYGRVISILEQAGGQVALRSEGPNPEVCVVVWAGGWAGETRHVSFCSRVNEPKNVVGRLDGDAARTLLHRTAGREVVYRHLDGTWYLREDG